MTTINVAVTDPNNTGTLTINSVSNGATVTTSTSAASSSNLSLNVAGGAGASGSSVLLAAGSGIAISETNGTATISSTLTAGAANLSGLSDVSFTSPTSGEVLAYNGTAWSTATVTSGGAANLSGLSDVSISSPSSGQVLAYNGTAWIAAADSTLTLSSTAGADLGNGTAGTSSEAARADHVHDSPNLSELADVSVSSPSAGQVLAYNGTAWSTATDSALTLTTTAAANHGAAAAGTSSEAARADHVHNTQNLSQLGDVDTANASSGQVLAYNGTSWIASADNAVSLSSSAPEDLGTAAAGTSANAARSDHVHAAQSLAELTDVTITTQTTGQVLAFNGTSWTTAADQALTLSTIAAADHGTAAAGTSSTAARADHVHEMPNLTSLSDVSAISPSSGQVLAWNGSAWAPVAQTGGTGGGASLSDANAEALGTAASGTSSDAARADHVHKMPSFEDVTNGTATITGNLSLDPSTGVTIIQGGTAGSAAIVLNCEANTHGVTIKSPAHSAAATYTLTLPDTAGTADQVLQTDGAGALSWKTISSSGISWTTAPASSATTGTAGQVAYDNQGYFYLHNGAQWLRTQLAAFSATAGVTITTHPQSVGLDTFEDAVFTVVFTTFGVTDVSLVWQLSTDSGNTWSTVAGETSSTLTISGVTDTDNGKQYRVIVTPSASPTSAITSNAATITVASVDSLLTESGNRLAAENSDLLVTEGTGSSGGGGSGGGSSGGSSTAYGQLSYERGASANEYLGRARVQLDYLGQRVLIFDNQFTAANTYGSPSSTPASAATTFKIRQGLSGSTSAYSSNEFTSESKAWLPNTVTMAGSADVVVGMFMNTDRTIELNTYTYSGTTWSASSSLQTGTRTYSEKAHAAPISDSNNYGNIARYEYRNRTALSDDGQHLAVSIPGFLTSETDRVYVYSWNSTGGGWTQRGIFTGPNDSDSSTSDGYHMGTQLLQISNNGNTLLVSDGGYGINSKIIRYDYNGDSLGTWTRKAIKTGGSGADSNGFAMAASKDGNRVVTGFDQRLNGSSTYQGRGAVRVHDYDNTTNSWSTTTIVDASTGAGAYDYNGYAVTISDDGNRIAYSATGYDSAEGAVTLGNTGQAYILRYDADTWWQVGQAITGTQSQEEMGQQLALSGDGERLLVSSPYYDNGTNTNSGRVVLYDFGTTSPPRNLLVPVPEGSPATITMARNSTTSSSCSTQVLVTWPSYTGSNIKYNVKLSGTGSHEDFGGTTASGDSTQTGTLTGTTPSGGNGNTVGSNAAAFQVAVLSSAANSGFGNYNITTTGGSYAAFSGSLSVGVWRDENISIHATWDRPLHNPEDVTSYILEKRAVGSSTWSVIKTVTAPAGVSTVPTETYLNTDDGFLTGGHEYEFRIKATTANYSTAYVLDPSSYEYEFYLAYSILGNLSHAYCDD